MAGAPWGSASILPISWAYVRLMGVDGLRRATLTAVAAANYVARRLDEHFPVLYTGPGGHVAHECILDLRPLTKASGISVDDIAKRLADYGFHAPTMSFPVAGTLMVEPTESEDLDEIDRFCDAMIAIRGEVARVESGEWPADDNPLVHAPFTARSVLTGTWDHAYTREEGVPAAGRPAKIGRRCAASTPRTATATSSAPARRWRSSRSGAFRARERVLVRRTRKCSHGRRPHVEHDLAGDPPTEQCGDGVLDLVPRSAQADVRVERARLEQADQHGEVVRAVGAPGHDLQPRASWRGDARPPGRC